MAKSSNSRFTYKQLDMYRSSSKDDSLVLWYAMAPHMQLPERGIVNKVWQS